MVFVGHLRHSVRIFHSARKDVYVLSRFVFHDVLIRTSRDIALFPRAPRKAHMKHRSRLFVRDLVCFSCPSSHRGVYFAVLVAPRLLRVVFLFPLCDSPGDDLPGGDTGAAACLPYRVFVAPPPMIARVSWYGPGGWGVWTGSNPLLCLNDSSMMMMMMMMVMTHAHAARQA